MSVHSLRKAGEVGGVRAMFVRGQDHEGTNIAMEHSNTVEHCIRQRSGERVKRAGDPVPAMSGGRPTPTGNVQVGGTTGGVSKVASPFSVEQRQVTVASALRGLSGKDSKSFMIKHIRR